MRTFTCRPSLITAAENTEDTRVADLTSIMKDDFNYVIDGFDKLNRDGNTAEALEIMTKLNGAIEEAIEGCASVLGE